MKYYLSDADIAYAWDDEKQQMYVCTKKGLKEVEGKPGLYWSGLTEEQSKAYEF